MRLPRLLRRLANVGIVAAVLLTLLLVLAAYQVRPTYDIPLGTPTDAPLLRGFNAGEVVPGDNGFKFRWSGAESEITLEDVGKQDLQVTLDVNGTRPAGQPPPQLKVLAGERPLVDEKPPVGPAQYTLQVPREALEEGTLNLKLLVNAFTPPGDPRQLGIMVTRIVAAPGTNPDRFIEPPSAVLLALGLCALVLGITLAMLGWSAWGVFLLASLPGLLAAALLITDRLWLTTGGWYTTWPSVALGGAVVVGLLYAAGGWLLQAMRTPWSVVERTLLLTLLLFVFSVRLAGQLHPQIFIVDLLFHLHRFATVQSGQLLFTIESAEFGGRSTFYLPTPYIMMLPLNWLLNNPILTIKVFTVLLSTLGGFVVYLIARKAARDGRAGLIAASLYLTVPMAVLPFSWGVTSNVFGEFFALCALAALVAGYPDLSPRRAAFWVMLVALTLALLSHPGVVQLTGAAFVSILAFWLLGRSILGRKGSAGTAWALGAVGAALVLAFVFYYRNFAESMINTFQDIQKSRAESSSGGLHLKIGGSVADKSLGLIVRFVDTRREWFFGGLRGFWQEAQAYYRVWPLAGALVGYVSIWHGATSAAERRRRALVLAALGWTLAVVLYALVGWVINLYVRYSLFALPVIALGAGLLLAKLARRGQSGRLVAALMVAFYAAEALALWHYRITYAFK